MSAEEKFVGFRADPRLVEKIKKRAKSEHRSLAAHMRWLVEQDLGGGGGSLRQYSPEGNDPAPLARRSSISYRSKKIKGQ
jgi:hypothetical protein